MHGKRVRGKDMEKYIIHLTYNKNLNLSSFNKICEIINASFNEVNRQNGVKNNKKIGELNPEITKFKEGSFILELLTNFIVPIASSVVVEIVAV